MTNSRWLPGAQLSAMKALCKIKLKYAPKGSALQAQTRKGAAELFHIRETNLNS
jgi:hypothetical protein